MGDNWVSGHGLCIGQWGDVCVMYGPVGDIWVIYG